MGKQICGENHITEFMSESKPGIGIENVCNEINRNLNILSKQERKAVQDGKIIDRYLFSAHNNVNSITNMKLLVHIGYLLRPLVDLNSLLSLKPLKID